MIEEWRKIRDVYGDYSVNNFGMIRNNRTGIILKRKDNGRNANLPCELGKQKSVSVGRIMWIAFHGDIGENDFVVCDDYRMHLGKLRLVSRSERTKQGGIARKLAYNPDEQPNYLLEFWLTRAWQ